ncbi:MAG TPA: tetratricopeptide repeat protein [Candidatus Obscuribacter sp.]|nr:tetratricopeptide repeat protein [Candidatus Obscuribacter sp.]HMW89218.1 tetratricopeptide repeat protein [Candidatus Obscuribacter sp.]HMX46644.1 tetratricopeptide repeat protein [Candidatus Obscuribacter sp.]HMY55054.1 tetratricopeptide repeat protein [Candidatus Obscuribacter sp.]HNA72387.1 tetratricopeptide repeat protein [Candidatus Obscuribacter sp.]
MKQSRQNLLLLTVAVSFFLLPGAALCQPQKQGAERASLQFAGKAASKGNSAAASAERQGSEKRAKKLVFPVASLSPVQRDAYNMALKADRCNSIMESEEALALCNQALKLDPHCWKAYLARGQAQINSNRPDQALSDFSRVIDSKDQYFMYGARRLRADLYCVLKRFAEAIKDIDALEAEGATLSDGMHETRAGCYSGLGKHAQAIADYTAAIALRPNTTRLRFKRAESYLHAGQYEKAVADYTRVIEVDGKDGNFMGGSPEAYLGRASAYDLLGRKDLANKDRAAARNADQQNYADAPFRSPGRK